MTNTETNTITVTLADGLVVPRRMVTPKQAKAIYGRDEQWFRRRRNLPRYKDGASVLYKVADIEAMFAAMRVPAQESGGGA